MGVAIKHTLGNTGNFIRYYWKKIAIIAVIALTVITGMAFADPAAGVRAIEDGTKFDPMLKMVFGWVDAIAGPEIIEKAGDLLSVYYDGTEIHVGPYSSAGAGAIIDAAFSISCALALVVLCISFFIDLAMTKVETVTEETVFRKLFMFIVGMILITSSLNLCLTIANVGTSVTNAIIDKMTNPGTGAVTSGLEEIKQIMYAESHTTEMLKEAGTHVAWYEDLGNRAGDLGAKFGFVVQLIFPYLATKLAWVIISVVCFSRAIELFLMAGFAPLAFMDSNAIDNFTTSPGWRFVKNIIAISIQGAIIAGVLAIGSSFITSVVVGSAGTSMDAFLEASIQIIMILFAEVSLVMRSQGIAKSVLAIG